jgi:hypothetical protein
MTADDTNVIKLRQPQPQAAAGVVVGDDPIDPKSLLNMTDVEQDMFLLQLRERRMRVVQVLKAAQQSRMQANTLASALKLEKKADQVQKQLDKATKALDKLEELVYGLRALHLQHTDMDITRGGGNDGQSDGRNPPKAG